MLNKNSENTKFLNNRLDFNGKYSKNDFISWLFEILGSIQFKDVLDAGCGTGKQTIWFSEKLNNRGSVSSFDISEKSIESINSKNIENIEAVVGSFDDIDNVLARLKVKEFDLIHSTYSMYYARNPLDLLNSLFNVIRPSGTLAICAPYSVNTFLNFLSNYQQLGQLNWDCMEFINDIVLNYAHRNFKEIKTHVFVNNLFVTSIDDLMENYRSSTFYDSNSEQKIAFDAEKIIREKGYFHIQKKSKIAICSIKR